MTNRLRLFMRRSLFKSMEVIHKNMEVIHKETELQKPPHTGGNNSQTPGVSQRQRQRCLTSAEDKKVLKLNFVWDIVLNVMRH